MQSPEVKTLSDTLFSVSMAERLWFEAFDARATLGGSLQQHCWIALGY